MSYPKQLLRLRPTHGLAIDLPASEVPPEFYTGGQNVIFRDGLAQRIGGSRQVYSQNVVNPVFHLLNVRAPGGITESNFWLAFGPASLQAMETSNTTDIEGAALSTVTSPWQWASTLLNNIPCFTNGLDAPRYWGGDVGTASTDLPGWPAGTVCKSIVAFKFHLFALDIDGPGGHFESQILWSDAAAPGDVPGTWTAAATNEAGDAILADTPGPCLCAAPLRDSLIVFKRASMYAVTYIGGVQVFNVQLLNGARGALTRRAIANIGGQILVVADGDVALTDGTNWQSIAQGRVRDFLFSQLDQSSYENLYVVYHRAKNEAWICYPSTGNTYADMAIVYNVATDDWGVRDLNEGTFAAVGVVNDTAPDESWDADSQHWDADSSAWNAANFSLATEQLVTAANSATLTLEDSGDAVSVNASVFRHDLTMGAPERFKFVRRMHVRTNTTPGTLYARVGARNSVTDAITWDTEQTLTTPDSFVNVRALGRFISAEIRSSGSDEWVIGGLDLEFEMRGY